MSIMITKFTPLNDRLLEIAFDLSNAGTEGVGPKEYHKDPKNFNMGEYLGRMSRELSTLALDWTFMELVPAKENIEKEGN